MPEPLLTVQEAAKLLAVSRGTIYGLCAAGRLAHLRIGLGRGTIRIDEKALAALKQEGQKRAKPVAARITLADLRQAL